VPIGALATAADIEVQLGQACVPLLARALPRLAAGTLTFTPQVDAAATYCRKLTKEDGVLDFAASARALAANINGLFPWPGCVVEMGGQAVKLGLADAVAAPSGVAAPAPGSVLGADAEALLVQTGDGVLRLRRLQRPGGKMIPTADFLRGFPVPAGTTFQSRPMPPLVTTR
ncbi:MAG: methionyl-tRNA formyltransferase, partial [Opitutaceae bacterium]